MHRCCQQYIAAYVHVSLEAAAVVSIACCATPVSQSGATQPEWNRLSAGAATNSSAVPRDATLGAHRGVRRCVPHWHAFDYSAAANRAERRIALASAHQSHPVGSRRCADEPVIGHLLDSRMASTELECYVSARVQVGCASSV